MEQDQYIKAILHKLYCTKSQKKKIEQELRADIQTAMEEGESWEEIKTRMGEPHEAAQEFNENFAPEEERRVKKQKRIVISCGIFLVFAAVVVGLFWMLPKSEMVDKKGKEHDDTFSQVKVIISLVEEEDYETIKQKYSDETMKQVLTKEQMDSAKRQIAEEWGRQVSLGKLYLSKIEQMGESYEMAQINVSYEHASVTYTMLFDKDRKLAGLYLK